MSKVIEVTDATFAAEVLQSDLPTLVDYWADWCAPCKQLSPLIDELSEVYSDRMKFVKVDTNLNTGVAGSQGIMALPTIQIFRNGQVVEQVQGGKTKMALTKLIEANI